MAAEPRNIKQKLEDCRRQVSAFASTDAFQKNIEIQAYTTLAGQLAKVLNIVRTRNNAKLSSKYSRGHKFNHVFLVPIWLRSTDF